MAAQFSRMAGSLHAAQVSTGIKRLLVTSVGAGEGKTLTSINLALALSESYRRSVLIVDADLRRPSLHRVCGFDRLRGLSEGLRAPQQEKLALVELSKTLSLLPAGRPDPDPMDGLTSERMQAILDEAGSRFDWVILDVPPIGLVPDAGLLAGMVDAVLFVIRADSTPLSLITRAVDAVGRDRVFGVVLNRVTDPQASEYGTYYHPHSPLGVAP